MADFITIIKSFMRARKLRDLSSMGWDRMKQVKRDLDNKKIDADDAIREFLKERDFMSTIGRDRHAMEELKKMFK